VSETTELYQLLLKEKLEKFGGLFNLKQRLIEKIWRIIQLKTKSN
jgi:hypothetical protein